MPQRLHLLKQGREKIQEDQSMIQRYNNGIIIIITYYLYY